VAPYREPAKDVEADLDAREVAAFKAQLARRALRVRAGTALVLMAVIAPALVLVALSVHVLGRAPAPRPAPRPSRCEARVLSAPDVGEPLVMTFCQ
jgi:hypothetical protein